MRLQFWSGHLFAVGLTALVLQLAGCGAGDGGTDPPAATRSKSSATSAADSSSADLINAALARGEIGAEAALTFKVFALFGDVRLPTRYQGAAGDESESDALEEASSRFASLSAATQQALAPLLRRPADLGSWASPEVGAKRLETEAGCKGQAARWAAVNPDAGGKVKVWYDTAVAGDQAIALAVSAAIDGKVWPALMDGGARPAPSDASLAGCDGGDARLDVYLVHGLRARGLTVPARGPDPSAVFALVNADIGPETTLNAAQGVMNAIQYARRIGANQANIGERKRALARSGTAGSTRTTAVAAAVAAQPVPSVVQLKAASMATAVVSVTLDLPVTAALARGRGLDDRCLPGQCGPVRQPGAR